MTQETLKKAVELNEKFQQLSKLFMDLKASQNIQITLFMDNYRKNELIQEYELTGVLRTALEKAVDDVFTEIKKEIEAL